MKYFICGSFVGLQTNGLGVPENAESGISESGKIPQLVSETGQSSASKVCCLLQFKFGSNRLYNSSVCPGVKGENLANSCETIKVSVSSMPCV